LISVDKINRLRYIQQTTILYSKEG